MLLVSLITQFNPGNKDRAILQLSKISMQRTVLLLCNSARNSGGKNMRRRKYVYMKLDGDAKCEKCNNNAHYNGRVDFGAGVQCRARVLSIVVRVTFASRIFCASAGCAS